MYVFPYEINPPNLHKSDASSQCVRIVPTAEAQVQEPVSAANALPTQRATSEWTAFQVCGTYLQDVKVVYAVVDWLKEEFRQDIGHCVPEVIVELGGNNQENAHYSLPPF